MSRWTRTTWQGHRASKHTAALEPCAPALSSAFDEDSLTGTRDSEKENEQSKLMPSVSLFHKYL